MRSSRCSTHVICAVAGCVAVCVAAGCKRQSSFENTIGMRMVRVPAGTTRLGNLNGLWGFAEPRFAARSVTIEKSFHIAATEVTQAQWKAVMGTNPSLHKGDDLPVENISWSEAAEFAKRLSRKEGRRYLLPTATEWEYACRACACTDFYFGNAKSAKNEIGRFAWYSGNSGNRTHKVGTRKPNKWGLHDMSGNVEEWCKGQSGTVNKPVVGGSAKDYGSHVPAPFFLVCFFSAPTNAGHKDGFLGFRLVLMQDQQKGMKGRTP